MIPQALRRLVYRTADRIGLLLKQRDELTPSMWMLRRNSDGSKDIRDYIWIGEGLTKQFINLGLKPDHRVLDLGSGNGRVALPLARHLDDKGSYEGFDIVAESVAWCNRTIGRRFPNTRFHCVDLYSERYNPAGQQRAADFQFPFADAEFDFIIAMSLFTHMLPADLEHYFEEMARVLKPGGKCVMTFFLLDAETPADGGGPGIRFDYAEGCRIADEEVPERAVGYDETAVRALCDRSDLAIASTYYGSWAGTGRQTMEGLQDCIVATRE